MQECLQSLILVEYSNIVKNKNKNKNNYNYNYKNQNIYNQNEEATRKEGGTVNLHARSLQHATESLYNIYNVYTENGLQQIEVRTAYSQLQDNRYSSDRHGHKKTKQP